MLKLKNNRNNFLGAVGKQAPVGQSTKINSQIKKKPLAFLYFREAVAIGLWFLGIFIYLGVYHEAETGLFGIWFVEYLLIGFFGKGTAYLPFFLGISGLVIFVSKKANIRDVSLGGFGSFLGLLAGLELRINGPVQSIRFPIPETGGGLIGYISGFVLHKIVGPFGSVLCLTTLFIVSLTYLFNISIRHSFLLGFNALKWVFSRAGNWTIKRKKDLDDNKPNWARSIFLLCCFRKRVPPAVESERIRDITKIAIQKKKTNVTEQNNRVSFQKKKVIDKEKPVHRKEFIDTNLTSKCSGHQLPPLSLLESSTRVRSNKQSQESKEKAIELEQALQQFNVLARVVNITTGPSVTRYELEPGQGVKISKITSLSQDIALKLAAPAVRIEAPIPGTSLIGVEVPNRSVDMIRPLSLIEKVDFMDPEKHLLCAMGMTITGEVITMALEKMPHVLIAGATGSGKSVCVNSIIMSILLRSDSETVKFLMIDPKKVELSLYSDIPHLLAPVVTNPHQAAATLKQWALVEMERRYESFAKVGAKDIAGFNKYLANRIHHKNLAEENLKEGESFVDERESLTPYDNLAKLPYIVVVIDELADLMMVASQDVENTICRLAQMARATGIHLVIATQRPSVNVVTGLIKANVPSRISFFVQSQIDSRTILDTGGAEKLIGKGDMLYMPAGALSPIRVQGVFVSEEEIKRVVQFVKTQAKPDYSTDVLEVKVEEPVDTDISTDDTLDDLFEEAKKIVQSTQYASTSYLQRKLRIGYNRAARLMDELEEKKIVSGYDGEKKGREVLS